VILLWGSNARETHPIFFHHVLKGIRNGAKLYVIDPRRTSSAQWADTWLGLDVGSDISLANAMAREIIAAGLAHTKFIEHATSGFAAYRDHVQKYTLKPRSVKRAFRLMPSSRLRMRMRPPDAHNSAGRLASPSTTMLSTMF
jgi:anaerobic selenocysteine-containing dehydrogenase